VDGCDTYLCNTLILAILNDSRKGGKMREYIINRLKTDKILFWGCFACVSLNVLSVFLELIQYILVLILRYLA
jgi:hypothetical protein